MLGLVYKFYYIVRATLMSTVSWRTQRAPRWRVTPTQSSLLEEESPPPENCSTETGMSGTSRRRVNTQSKEVSPTCCRVAPTQASRKRGGTSFGILTRGSIQRRRRRERRSLLKEEEQEQEALKRRRGILEEEESCFITLRGEPDSLSRTTVIVQRLVMYSRHCLITMVLGDIPTQRHGASRTSLCHTGAGHPWLAIL